MAQKTSLVCVLNVAQSMQLKLDAAKAFLSSFLTQKMISSKTFELGVVAYGADVTSNHLNRVDADQYVGVNTVVELETPTVHTLRNIRDISISQSDLSQPPDIIDGIVIGYNILELIGKKKCNRLLLIITDGEEKIDGVADLEAIVNRMVLYSTHTTVHISAPSEID